MARESNLQEVPAVFSALQAEIRRIQELLLNPGWLEQCETIGNAN
jgi:hypothetical protein